jgi:hypothetical protein
MKPSSNPAAMLISISLRAGIRIDSEFENRGCLEIDYVVFALYRGAIGAEVPLLPYYFLKALARAAGPSHREFLGSRDFGFMELEAHALDRLRLIKRQPDPLFARRSSAPARSRPKIEGRFNRVAVRFRSNLDLGQFLQIEPMVTIWCTVGKQGWAENAFSHDFIVAPSTPGSSLEPVLVPSAMIWAQGVGLCHHRS